MLFTLCQLMLLALSPDTNSHESTETFSTKYLGLARMCASGYWM